MWRTLIIYWINCIILSIVNFKTVTALPKIFCDFIDHAVIVCVQARLENKFPMYVLNTLDYEDVISYVWNVDVDHVMVSTTVDAKKTARI
jgi:hypothetical protein